MSASRSLIPSSKYELVPSGVNNTPVYCAIDPGEFSGWSLLSADLKLVKCGIDRPPMLPYKAVLIERPTIYPHTKVDPNNIVTLSLNAGNHAGRLETLGARVHWVEPRTWKGSVPKHIHHPRILAALSPLEQDVVSVCGKGISIKKIEDMMDSIGLAQYAKRMHLFLP